MALGLRNVDATSVMMTVGFVRENQHRRGHLDHSLIRTREGQVKVRERDIRHEQVDSVVDRLHVQEPETEDAVIRLVQTREMRERVDAGGERTAARRC